MVATIGYIDETLGPVPVTQNEPLPVSLVDVQGPKQAAYSQSVAQATDDGFALKASSYSVAPVVYASQAAEASKLLKVGNGVVVGFDGYNAKGSAQFILLFDKASVPADGDIPIFALTAATAANFSKEFGPTGLRFQNGLAISNSSTVATRTVGSADCQFFVRYK